jgi:hypothetical protein
LAGLPDAEDQMIRMPIAFAYRSLVAVSAVAAPLLTASVPAAAQAAFNGTWSVLIVTDKGPCDRAYRYPVRVSNGRVSYAGQSDFDVSGEVARNGAVNVSVAKGGQRASGSGRLSGSVGSGTWRGSGTSDGCSGSWTAEKRG